MVTHPSFLSSVVSFCLKQLHLGSRIEKHKAEYEQDDDSESSNIIESMQVEVNQDPKNDTDIDSDTSQVQTDCSQTIPNVMTSEVHCNSTDVESTQALVEPRPASLKYLDILMKYDAVEVCHDDHQNGVSVLLLIAVNIVVALKIIQSTETDMVLALRNAAMPINQIANKFAENNKSFVIIHMHEGLRDMSLEYLEWVSIIYRTIHCESAKAINKVYVLTSSSQDRSLVCLSNSFVSAHLLNKVKFFNSKRDLVKSMKNDSRIDIRKVLSRPKAESRFLSKLFNRKHHALDINSQKNKIKTKSTSRRMSKLFVLQKESVKDIGLSAEDQNCSAEIAPSMLWSIRLPKSAKSGDTGLITIGTGQLRRRSNIDFRKLMAKRHQRYGSNFRSARISHMYKRKRCKREPRSYRFYSVHNGDHTFCRSTDLQCINKPVDGWMLDSSKLTNELLFSRHSETLPLSGLAGLLTKPRPSSGPELQRKLSNFAKAERRFSNKRIDLKRFSFSLREPDVNFKQELSIDIANVDNSSISSTNSKLSEETLGDSKDNRLPFLVQDCASHLLARYLCLEEGIFRVPGSRDEVSKLIGAYENGERPLLTQSSRYSTITVASTLKAYFRSLSEAMVTGDPFFEVVRLSKSTDKDITLAYQLGDRMVGSLSSNNYDMLGYLCHFLNFLSTVCSRETRMDTQNLSTVWAPSILESARLDKKKEDENCDRIQQLMFLPHSVRIMRCMITFSDIVFPEELLNGSFAFPIKALLHE